MSKKTKNTISKSIKIEVDGITWYRYPNGDYSSGASRYYYRPLGSNKRVDDLVQGETFLHRYIWRRENSWKKIPEGYQIHHIDGNTTNNDIANLKRMKTEDHLALKKTTHSSFCQECGKTIYASRDKKYCSFTCRNAYNREHTETWKTFTCETCGKEIKAPHKRIYCDKCYVDDIANRETKNVNKKWKKNGALRLALQKPIIMGTTGKIFHSQMEVAKYIKRSPMVISNMMTGRTKNRFQLSYATGEKS